MESKDFENLNSCHGPKTLFTGFLYEVKIIFLFMIRACLNNITFDLVTNPRDCGKFDDVFINCQPINGNKKLLCVQVKHLLHTSNQKITIDHLHSKPNVSKRPKNENYFELCKYRESIKKTYKNSSKTSIISNYDKNLDCDFIFYTTSPIADTNNVEIWNDVEDGNLSVKLLNTCSDQNYIKRLNENNEILLEETKRDDIFLTKILMLSNQILDSNFEDEIKKELVKFLGKQEVLFINKLYNNILYHLLYFYQNTKSSSNQQNYANIGASASTNTNSSPKNLHYDNLLFLHLVWDFVLQDLSTLSFQRNLNSLKCFTINFEHSFIKKLQKDIIDNKYLVIDIGNNGALLAALTLYRAVNDSKFLNEFNNYMFIQLQHLANMLDIFKYCRDLVIIDCTSYTDQNKTEIEDVKKIANHCNKKKVVFLVSHPVTSFSLENSKVINFQYEYNFLSIDTQKFISESYIVFQGENIKLGELLENNCDIVDCESIEQLITGNSVTVGTKVGELNLETSCCYIQRSYHCTHFVDSSIIIDEFLQSESSEVMLVSVQNDDHLLGENYKYFKHYTEVEQNSNCRLFYYLNDIHEVNKEPFNYLISNFPKKNIHWFKKNENYFLWYESYNSIENIEKYVMTCTQHGNIISELGVCEDILVKSTNKMNILVETAGMGKSTSLKVIAGQLKKQNTKCWVHYLNLAARELYENFEELAKDSTRIEISQLQKLLFTNPTILEAAILTYLYDNNRLIFCLDAFDEISQKYENECMMFIKKLENAKQIWLTSREHMKKFLMENFHVFPIILLPFSEQQQFEYFVKFFNHKLSKDYLIPENDTKIIAFSKALKNSLACVDDSILQMMEIPLIANMLANINLHQCKESLKNKGLHEILPITFKNIYDLYELFVTETITRYLEVKVGLSRKHPTVYLDSLLRKYTEIYTFLAANHLFGETSNLLITGEQTLRFEKKLKKKENFDTLIRIGIVTSLNNSIAQFFHFTFAEFLVASYISINLENSKDTPNLQAILDEVFYNKKWRLMRRFINFANLPLNCNYKPLQVDTDRKAYNSLLIALDEENQNIAELITKCLNSDDLAVKKWISKKAALCTIFGTHNSALHAAAAKGYKSLIPLLLEKGANIDITNDIRKTPLMIAAYTGNDEVLKELIKGHAKINRVDLTDKTPLMKAAHEGHVDVVKTLLNHGADINAADDRGETALFSALRKNQDEVVEILLQNGANVNYRSFCEETAIMFAAKYLSKSVMLRLLDFNVNLHDIDNDGKNLLVLSAENKHYEVLDHLIARGIYSLNSTDNKRRTALHIAAKHGHHLHVRSLINAGAEINLQDEAGKTPLHKAVLNVDTKCGSQSLVDHEANHNIENKIGYACILEDLLKKGADTNHKDLKGRTPLMKAAHEGHVDVVKTLLHHGADIDAADDRGETVLFSALRRDQNKVVEILLQNGANANYRNACQETAIMFAAKNSNVLVMLNLLDCNVNLHDIDNDGKNLLLLSAENNNYEVLAHLIARGIYSPNFTDNKGRTALHIAAKHGHHLHVKSLLNAGAETDLRDVAGNTPLHKAVMNVDTLLCIQIMVEHGANYNIKNKEGKLVIDLCVCNNAKKWLLNKFKNETDKKTVSMSDNEPNQNRKRKFSSGETSKTSEINKRFQSKKETEQETSSSEVTPTCIKLSDLKIN